MARLEGRAWTGVLILVLLGAGGCGGEGTPLPPSALELDRMAVQREGPAAPAPADLMDRLAEALEMAPAETLDVGRVDDLAEWHISLRGLDPACLDSLRLRLRTAADTRVQVHFTGGGEVLERGMGPSLPVVGGTWQPVGLRLPSRLRACPEIEDVVLRWPVGAADVQVAGMDLHPSTRPRSLCTVDGRTRPALRLPAGGSLTWSLEEPASASLELAWSAWSPDSSILHLVVSDGDEEIHRQAVSPGDGWHPLHLPPRRWTAPRLRLEGAGGHLFVATPRLRLAEAERENILLIVIDTLRADHLGCYGNPREVSPHLDAFAAGALRFQRAWAPAPWTHPSTASLHSGLWPGRHGLGIVPGRFTGFRPGTPRLARELQRAGYATAAVSNNPIVSPDEDFGLGFDCFDQRPFVDHERRGAERVTRGALQWLGERGDAPFFLYLHYFDPHDPYWAPEGYRDRFTLPSDRRFASLVSEGSVNRVQDQFARVERRGARRYKDLARYLGALYDGEIAYCDHWIGVLLDELRDRGLLEKTTVLITSDHGEELLDHGGFKHAHSLYQELIHVPLLLRPAGGLEEGRVIQTPVNLIDVMPTLLRRARAGLPPPSLTGGLPGRDLLEIADHDAGPAARRQWSVSFGSFFEQRNPAFQPRRAVLDWPFKLIHDQEPDTFQLYDLAADPGETEDLADRHPGKVRTLAAAADSVLRRRGPVGEGGMTPELRAKLESLGYVD